MVVIRIWIRPTSPVMEPGTSDDVLVGCTYSIEWAQPRTIADGIPKAKAGSAQRTTPM